MRYRDLLVHLDASPQSTARLDVAIDLARRHEAHLAALFVVDLALPVMAMADAGAGAALSGLLEDMRAAALEDGRRVEETFRARVARDAIRGEWRLAEGMLREEVTLHARYADLAIVGQDNPETSEPGAPGLVGDVLFGAGRPVLVVPYAGRFATVGRRVVVGWNASREAARAVNDALPLISTAETTCILAANPTKGIAAHGAEPGADIALHLARHGVSVTVEHRVAPDVPDADLLLNHASDVSADLLVVGAYGHSRLREFILGGVTRRLLREMTLPVLMSH